ncbi:MAG TPA: DUF2334 domain-containing protein [Fibrobacteria bacterium]|nr:DUF2334 domain-containing protein [Fibrobacteria bacterium]
MRFLLSIHDVWPGNFPLVAGYLARLRSLGAARIALLVVPAYHGRAPMDGNAEFLAWLREESRAGTELLLHGYHHRTIEKVEGTAYRGRRNAYGRWVNRRLVAQEAEFCGLPAEDRERLLDLGLASWRRAALPLAGFVAPTWHGSPPRGSLLGRGLDLWETRFRVHSLARGRSRFAPPLAWSLSKGTGVPELSGGRAWLQTLIKLPVMKVAIHPGDLVGDAAVRVLETVLAAGTNSTYAGLFGPLQPGPGFSNP